MQATIPGLTRSSLHRCLQCHGISRLPNPDAAPARKRFKAYPIGFVHIDIAEVRTKQGKLHLFVAIDRTSKFAFVQLHDRATRRIAANFLRAVTEAVLFKNHTVLTDNGVQFIHNLPDHSTPEEEAAIDAYWAARDEPRIHLVHAFDYACTQLGIEHRMTKPYHPWTNGQVERMNRTVKEATVKAFHYPDPNSLKAHVLTFVSAYNYAKHLKALQWRTPFEAMCQAWTTTPEISNQTHAISSRDQTPSLGRAKMDGLCQRGQKLEANACTSRYR